MDAVVQSYRQSMIYCVGTFAKRHKYVFSLSKSGRESKAALSPAALARICATVVYGDASIIDRLHRISGGKAFTQLPTLAAKYWAFFGGMGKGYAVMIQRSSKSTKCEAQTSWSTCCNSSTIFGLVVILVLILGDKRNMSSQTDSFPFYGSSSS